jgi:hypothetical protein
MLVLASLQKRVEWPPPANPALASVAIVPALSSAEFELSFPGGVVIRGKA